MNYMKHNVILVPGLGGSVLFNNKNQKIWPPVSNVLFPTPINLLSNLHNDIACTTPQCLENTSLKTILGDPNGLIGDDWFSKYILKDTFYDKYTKIIKPYSFAYDFRLIINPIYLDNLYNKYTKFINELDQPAIIFCHSLGGLVFHDYLTNRDPKWIKNKIEKIVYINTPFDGSPLVYKYILESQRKSFIFNNNIDLIGGLYWCLPWYEPNKEVLEIKSQKYKVRDLPNLTRLKDQYQNFVYPKKINRLKEIQGTKSIIIYSSSKKPTIEKINLTNLALSTNDKLGGDSSVPYSSLVLPINYWKNVESIQLENTDHTSILQDHRFLDLCKNIIN